MQKTRLGGENKSRAQTFRMNHYAAEAWEKRKQGMMRKERQRAERIRQQKLILAEGRGGEKRRY